MKSYMTLGSAPKCHRIISMMLSRWQASTRDAVGEETKMMQTLLAWTLTWRLPFRALAWGSIMTWSHRLSERLMPNCPIWNRVAVSSYFYLVSLRSVELWTLSDRYIIFMYYHFMHLFSPRSSVGDFLTHHMASGRLSSLHLWFFTDYLYGRHRTNPDDDVDHKTVDS